MERKTFEKLYSVYLRVPEGKIKLSSEDCTLKCRVSNINPRAGIITLQYPDVYKHFRFTDVNIADEFEAILLSYPQQEVADMINRNERVWT